MNITSDAKNALCAEYVLGTLRGKARERFQTMMMQSPSLRETTWFWEQHLNEMGTQLAPVKPDEAVWERIASQLGFTPKPATVTPIASAQKPRVWQSLSALATAAALVLAVLLVQVDTQPQVPQYSEIAIFNDADAKPLWVLEIADDFIQVRPTTSLQARTQNDYQLWIVAKDGRAPISLGLLPQQGSMRLDKLAIYDQVDIGALAVSLEPLGGSPTGQPTEVLYTTEVITL